MKPILLNLDTNIDTHDYIEMMQGYDYTLECNLYSEGATLDLTGYNVRVEMKLGNSSFIVQTKDITVSGNKVTAILDKDFTNHSGSAALQIVISKNDRVNGSWLVNCRIKPSALGQSDDTKSKVDITETLSNAITEAESTKADLDASISNGNVEKIRSDVDEINNVKIPAINSSLDTKSTYVTPEEFYIAIESDETKMIQRALDSGKNVIFKNPHTITMPLVLSHNEQKIDFNFKKITTSGKFRSILETSDNGIVDCDISNILFDCMDNTDYGIFVRKAKRTNFNKVFITNYKIGVLIKDETLSSDSNGHTYEVNFDKLTLDAKITTPIGSKGYVIKTSDCMLTNSIIGGEIGIECYAGTNIFDNIHCWGWAQRKCFYIQSDYVTITNCICDAPVDVAFEVIGKYNKVSKCLIQYADNFPSYIQASEKGKMVGIRGTYATQNCVFENIDFITLRDGYKILKTVDMPNAVMFKNVFKNFRIKDVENNISVEGNINYTTELTQSKYTKLLSIPKIQNTNASCEFTIYSNWGSVYKTIKGNLFAKISNSNVFKLYLYDGVNLNKSNFKLVETSSAIELYLYNNTNVGDVFQLKINRADGNIIAYTEQPLLDSVVGTDLTIEYITYNDLSVKGDISNDYVTMGANGLIPKSGGTFGIGSSTAFAKHIITSDFIHTHPRGTLVSSPLTGSIIIDSRTKKIIWFDGSTSNWRDCMGTVVY